MGWAGGSGTVLCFWRAIGAGGRRDRRWFGSRYAKVTAEEHTHLARDANVPEAIGAIAGHFDVDGRVVADRLVALEVQTGHREAVGQLVDRHFEVDVFLEPIPTDNHLAVPRCIERNEFEPESPLL